MLLQDKTLHMIEFELLVKQGLSLCLHAPNWVNDYYFRLYTNQFKYCVDRIIVISGLNQLIHPLTSIQNPNFISLYDKNHEWLSTLSHPEESTFLAERLRCHQLWRDGICIGYWYAPVTNPWKHFKQWLITKKYSNYENTEDWVKKTFPDLRDREWILNQLKKKDDSIFFHGSRAKLVQPKNSNLLHTLRWYNLVPNLDLENMLDFTTTGPYDNYKILA